MMSADDIVKVQPMHSPALPLYDPIRLLREWEEGGQEITDVPSEMAIPDLPSGVCLEFQYPNPDEMTVQEQIQYSNIGRWDEWDGSADAPNLTEEDKKAIRREMPDVPIRAGFPLVDTSEGAWRTREAIESVRDRFAAGDFGYDAIGQLRSVELVWSTSEDIPEGAAQSVVTQLFIDMYRWLRSIQPISGNTANLWGLDDVDDLRDEAIDCLTDRLLAEVAYKFEDDFQPSMLQ